jgi:ribonuclease HII
MALAKSLSKINAGFSSQVLLDGSLKAPKEYKKQKTIIKGDEKEVVIALASIVAKVHRDKLMTRQSKKFPSYGFADHVGYGTKRHYEAIKKSGLTILHRKSFI